MAWRRFRLKAHYLLTPETETCRGPWAEAHAKDLFNYKMLIQREMEQDATLWETPQ